MACSSGSAEDKVAFPIDRFWIRGDRLVIRGVTENDIGAMDDYRDQVPNYRRVGGNERIEFKLWQ
jgi:hypothetical protein